MARNLSRFVTPLAKVEDAGLESTDPRIVAITDLVEAERWTEAADRAEEMFDQGIYDIRPIGTYLWVAFAEGGFTALPALLAAVAALSGENADAIGPTKKRDEQIDRRFAWLFEKLADAFRYHQAKLTPEWQAWNEGADEHVFSDAEAAARSLATLVAVGPRAATARSLGRVVSWLADRKEELTRAPRRRDEPATATPTPTKTSDPPAVVDQNPLVPPRHSAQLVVSERFNALTAKLKAFEMLIEGGQLQKAALVGDDVLAEIESFDPRAYFPEVFARFSGLMSKNVDALATHWEGRESPQWKAMLQFYRVDLKGFVDR